jgi:hypothetical protein
MGNEKCTQNFGQKPMGQKEHFGGLDIDGGIIM